MRKLFLKIHWPTGELMPMVPKKAVLRTLPLLSQGDSQGLSRQQPRGSLRVPEQEATAQDKQSGNRMGAVCSGCQWVSFQCTIFLE